MKKVMSKAALAEQTLTLKDYTKYEKARMIGSRGLQLAMGAPFLLDLTVQKLEVLRYNPIEIALKEYEEGILPITVKRPSPQH